MYYKIKGYDEVTDEHLLENENNRTYKVDLVVTGELPESDNIKTLQEKIDYCKSLIGKAVFVKELTPCVYIGNGIEIIEDEEKKNKPFIVDAFKKINNCFSLKQQ